MMMTMAELSRERTGQENIFDDIKARASFKRVQTCELCRCVPGIPDNAKPEMRPRVSIFASDAVTVRTVN